VAERDGVYFQTRKADGSLAFVPVDAQLALADKAADKPAPPASEPKVVEGLGDGELLRRIRERVVDRAVRDGVPVPGGGTRKVAREQAEQLVQRVPDSDILDYSRVKGAPAQGALKDFLSWLWEHRDEIINWVLSILALFGGRRAGLGPDRLGRGTGSGVGDRDLTGDRRVGGPGVGRGVRHA